MGPDPSSQVGSLTVIVNSRFWGKKPKTWGKKPKKIYSSFGFFSSSFEEKIAKKYFLGFFPQNLRKKTQKQFFCDFYLIIFFLGFFPQVLRKKSQKLYFFWFFSSIFEFNSIYSWVPRFCRFWPISAKITKGDPLSFSENEAKIDIF